MFSDSIHTHKEHHHYLSLFQFLLLSSFLDVPFFAQQVANQSLSVIKIVYLLLSSNAQYCQHQYSLHLSEMERN
jgi:hypothetical protein